ncbi:uncharacterized protein [Dermacentor andersoni]|uniref:uncharacterized protein isoform X2 n=1 Tax=Dermacentor andersoni TaxID=34620 RepID=UPI003B3B891D
MTKKSLNFSDAKWNQTLIARVPQEQQLDTLAGCARSAQASCAMNAPSIVLLFNEPPINTGHRVCAATTITLSSSSRHSDEDSTLDDEVENVQRELSRLLAALEEGKGRPPHTTCPPRCTCPLTSWYAQSARAAVSLSAFLAFHDAPLPDQPGGVTDPVVAMALEWMLRHLEQGANEGDRSASQ